MLDNEAVNTLCKVLWHPGSAAVGGAADPRIIISGCAETNLKLVVFFIKHQARVMRVVRYADVTLQAIRHLTCQ